MKTLSYALPMTLAFATGCSATLAERSPAAPTPRASVGEITPASACLVTGPSRTIAPRARVLPGIEVASSTNKLVLRVATKLGEVAEMEMDPASGATMPVSGRESSAAHAAVRDACPTHLENARTMPGDPPFAIGTSGGKLAWSSCVGGSPALLDLAQPSVQDLQVVSLQQSGGFAVAFRQG